MQAVERLVQGADSGCPSEKQRQTVLNCTRLLTRVLPYIFEDADWRGFFWSTVPGAGRAKVRLWSQNPTGALVYLLPLCSSRDSFEASQVWGHRVAFRVWIVSRVTGQNSHRYLSGFLVGRRHRRANTGHIVPPPPPPPLTHVWMEGGLNVL